MQTSKLRFSCSENVEMQHSNVVEYSLELVGGLFEEFLCAMIRVRARPYVAQPRNQIVKRSAKSIRCQR